jgi:hypothetical protein
MLSHVHEHPMTPFPALTISWTHIERELIGFTPSHGADYAQAMRAAPHREPEDFLPRHASAKRRRPGL